MAIVQHRQIADAIKSTYAPHIDVSDVADRSAQEIGVRTLSRGLAAYALAYLVGVDAATAGTAVTDGYNDNGVDAIYYERDEKTLYIVQSKWNESHSGSVDLSDVLKFLKGTKDILSSRFDLFNDKIRKRSKEIDLSINQAGKVVVVIVYSGSSVFSNHNTQAMESFIDEVDETRELVSYQIVNQSQLYNMLLQGAVGASISSSLTLVEWGHIGEPIKAYYGQIAASDLAALHNKFGHRLFSRNVRMFLGEATQVNTGIQDTVNERADLFWYLNNGITALAASIHRRAAGGATRTSGTFDCEGLTIVNGAQTIGSISVAAMKNPAAAQAARVPIRIVSLEGAPDGFSSLITRTNNTQNRMDARNFVALDPVQERLRAEFAIDKIDYEYRQGEVESSGANRLGLVEATIALACSQPEVDLAVQAKREIGKLWEDISRPPYKVLFHSGRTIEDIWNRVLAFRRVDGQISILQMARGGKSGSVVTHGNRLLFHIVYKHLLFTRADAGLRNIKDEDLALLVDRAIDLLVGAIESDYPDSYVASLFKNLSKCKRLAAVVADGLVGGPVATA